MSWNKWLRSTLWAKWGAKKAAGGGPAAPETYLDFDFNGNSNPNVSAAKHITALDYPDANGFLGLSTDLQNRENPNGDDVKMDTGSPPTTLLCDLDGEDLVKYVYNVDVAAAHSVRFHLEWKQDHGSGSSRFYFGNYDVATNGRGVKLMWVESYHWFFRVRYDIGGGYVNLWEQNPGRLQYYRSINVEVNESAGKIYIWSDKDAFRAHDHADLGWTAPHHTYDIPGTDALWDFDYFGFLPCNSGSYANELMGKLRRMQVWQTW